MSEPFFGHADPVTVRPGARIVLAGIRPRYIAVQRISERTWRLRDVRESIDIADRVLGFVEVKGDRFELMQLAPGFAWFSYGSLAETAAHFTRERTE